MTTIASGCAVCSVETTKYCKRCKCMYYCSEECQKKDWSKHKLVCHLLKMETGKVTEGIAEQWTRENQELFKSSLMLYTLMESDTDKFMVFMSDKSFHIMTIEEVKKKIVGNRDMTFWESTFKLHENRGESDISVIIPYNPDGTGCYHFMFKHPSIDTLKKNIYS